MHKQEVHLPIHPLPLGATGVKLARIAGIVGGVSLLAAVGLGSMQGEGGLRHVMFSYLVAFMFCLSLALGAMFFVLIQFLVRAGWSVVVRRIGEVATQAFVPLAILSLPIVVPVILGKSPLFPWNEPGIAEKEPLLAAKSGYLNSTFFAIRAVLYFGIWITLSRFYFRNSTLQDQTSDPSITVKLQKFAPVGIILSALTLTFAAFDWMMSLTPTWFSTMFGVYYFAGSMWSWFSLLAVLAFVLSRRGFLDHAVNKEHFHDIGKFVFGFTIFWAYIAFSQYFLIWYSNIPEETQFYMPRVDLAVAGQWAYYSGFLLLGHFFIPFFGLMSRHVKRTPALLAAWCCFTLMMHYIDIYWIIMPTYGQLAGTPGVITFSLIDVATFLGVAGSTVSGVLWLTSSTPLVAEHDPRLPESLAFKNF